MRTHVSWANGGSACDVRGISTQRERVAAYPCSSRCAPNASNLSAVFGHVWDALSVQARDDCVPISTLAFTSSQRTSAMLSSYNKISRERVHKACLENPHSGTCRQVYPPETASRLMSPTFTAHTIKTLQVFPVINSSRGQFPHTMGIERVLSWRRNICSDDARGKLKELPPQPDGLRFVLMRDCIVCRSHMKGKDNRDGTARGSAGRLRS